MDALKEIVQVIFTGRSALRVRIDRICRFDASPMVLWANPANTWELHGLHRAVHKRTDPVLCHEHYRPANLIPHCSLGTAVEDSNRAAALALAAQSFEPFDVLFDSADCVTFPPVRVRSRVELIYSLATFV